MATALNHASVALDIESNGFHRYPERVCLVQLAVGDRIYLIDPLTIDDMAPLGELLSAPSVVKLFHSADYDIRSLDRDWGFRVSPLFDTSIAAAFVGHRNLGLASVLQECLNIEIPKTKKLQRADWTVRPLSRELKDYAASDVRYLKSLAVLLHRNIDDLGRTEWVREECERIANVRYAPSDTETAFLSLKGNRALDSRGLAILKSLHAFREHEAVKYDRPPFKVFSNAVMLSLASQPHSDLSTLKGIGRYAYGSGASKLRKALREGTIADPIERPRSGRPKRLKIRAIERSAARERLRSLKCWRTQKADLLGLAPGMIWPASNLEHLAMEPTDFDNELQWGNVRRWQRNELGESLLECIKRLNIP